MTTSLPTSEWLNIVISGLKNKESELSDISEARMIQRHNDIMITSMQDDCQDRSTLSKGKKTICRGFLSYILTLLAKNYARIRNAFATAINLHILCIAFLCDRVWQWNAGMSCIGTVALSLLWPWPMSDNAQTRKTLPEK